MPQEGFEPKIPVFKRTKMVHVFDRAATVIGHIAIIPKPKHEFLAVAIPCYILLRELVKTCCSLHKYYPVNRHSYPQLCHVHSGKYHNIDHSVLFKPTYDLLSVTMYNLLVSCSMWFPCVEVSVPKATIIRAHLLVPSRRYTLWPVLPPARLLLFQGIRLLACRVINRCVGCTVAWINEVT
jgi:hypothetical protein